MNPENNKGELPTDEKLIYILDNLINTASDDRRREELAEVQKKLIIKKRNKEMEINK